MEPVLLQRQTLTPAMQTSLRVLQLNNLQLRSYLSELMNTNAVVELEYPDMDCRPSPFDRLHDTRQTRQPGERTDEFSKEQLMEDKASATSALHDLFLQCAALNISPADRRMVRYLIQSLDERGFLTETAEAAAQDCGVPTADVRRCICLLQGMEPAGVGAADLRDCLRLQLLRATPQQDRLALQIVDGYLECMAKQQYSQIARALGVTKAQVEHSCDRIRTLNPKPLNGLCGEAVTQYLIPDFYVIEEDGCLHCIMNDYFLPKIKIDSSYRALLRGKTLSEEDAEYIRRNYKQADEVMQFLSYRKSTLQRVVDFVLIAQQDFFRRGPGHRAALSNHELAEALSLHESTVSRAVSGKFFECKWGVFPLKSLLVRSVKAVSSEQGSYDRILHHLQQLIAAEPIGSAYSDQQLIALLSEADIHIARRTVAKYRQMLGIPTASRRNAMQGARKI